MHIDQFGYEIEKIIKDLENGKDKPDSVPGPEVHYTCPTCAEWYSKATAPNRALDIVNDKVVEKLYCDCHGNETKLVCAESNNFNSPYMTWQREELQRLKFHLEHAKDQVSDYMNSYLHDS